MPAARHVARRLAWPAALLLGGHFAAEVVSADAKPRFGVHVDTEYTSNLFHEQDRRLDLLRGGTQEHVPDQRYTSMVGPEDVVTTPGAEVGLRWKHHKLGTKLSLGAEYAIHARNPIADYLLLDATASRDLTPRDSLSLEFQITPTRFKKNYVDSDLPNQKKTFARADYLDWQATLVYDREWTERWRTTVEASFEQARYDDPFANHDENTYAGALNLEFDPDKRLTLAFGVEAGLTLTPGKVDPGVTRYPVYPVDRGHRDVEPSFEVTLQMPLHFDVEASVAYRIRNYTTGEALDVLYHDRLDRRLTVGGGVTKHFGPFALALDSSFADSDSHRKDQDPVTRDDPDPDAYGYQEFRVGLGCEYRYE